MGVSLGTVSSLFLSRLPNITSIMKVVFFLLFATMATTTATTATQNCQEEEEECVVVMKKYGFGYVYATNQTTLNVTEEQVEKIGEAFYALEECKKFEACLQNISKDDYYNYNDDYYKDDYYNNTITSQNCREEEEECVAVITEYSIGSIIDGYATNQTTFNATEEQVEKIFEAFDAQEECKKFEACLNNNSKDGFNFYKWLLPSLN